ncbi:hypothetical protein O1611_g2311 [Lasiodiplodia mahajangana]|uniref:Uncharacterized protein n=1 Tax=Lasiodiplodia mahajangana TaxID=1108764 RepID=A0ACC2JUX7_9PEZI|nr:hypothetical protein O1611_g2311 [Lasiodiplodia mahajangana]
MAIPTPNQFVTNITLPRNAKFTGRDDILVNLHSILRLGIEGDLDDRRSYSCLVHATGGMGKTETALEYTFRLRGSYKYIFWLRSQTEELLLASFLEVVSILGLAKDRSLSAKEPWLLVYDNAEQLATIRQYWPASVRGAIIITSQNPALGIITTQQILLPPMTLDEGSQLIQNILQRGVSEKEEASQLCEHLGGLPLAIAHFSGAILRSQCTISQMSRSFLQRALSSKIWAMDNDTSASRQYNHTLNTVWDFAIERLSGDSRQLLEIIAFIDPDQIPVDLFLKLHVTPDLALWNIERLNQAVSGLCERNLVERYQHDELDTLRTHRALQRSILQRLDNDPKRRDRVFMEAVSLVRQALPPADFVKRGDPKQLKAFTDYLPQVVSLHSNFVQSEPTLPQTLELSTILHDAAFYGNHGLGQLSIPRKLLSTAGNICSSILESDSKRASEMLVHVLSSMGPLDVHLGSKDAARIARVVELLEDERQGAPFEQWTEEQRFLFARAQDDYGWFLVQTNQIDEAIRCFDRSVGHFQASGENLLMQLSACNRVVPLAVRQEKERVRAESAAALAAIVSSCGADSPTTVAFKFTVACAFFTIGDNSNALPLFEESFKARSAYFGAAHHLALGCQYCLAVSMQADGELEEAEKNLRAILSINNPGDGWREEDVMRVRFRLVIVLRKQNRPREADKISIEVDTYLQELRTAADDATLDDESLMAILDANVTISHGRTAGMWNDGTNWRSVDRQVPSTTAPTEERDGRESETRPA